MAMIEGKAEVLYSYDPVGQETPFSYDAIRNIEFYNYKINDLPISFHFHKMDKWRGHL